MPVRQHARTALVRDCDVPYGHNTDDLCANMDTPRAWYKITMLATATRRRLSALERTLC
jgi:hypothetical protein